MILCMHSLSEIITKRQRALKQTKTTFIYPEFLAHVTGESYRRKTRLWSLSVVVSPCGTCDVNRAITWRFIDIFFFKENGTTTFIVIDSTCKHDAKPFVFRKTGGDCEAILLGDFSSADKRYVKQAFTRSQTVQPCGIV